MSDPKTLTVHLLGKDYQVSCPPGQERGLERAAQRLDQQMQAIRNGGKIIGLERIAVMAALNLTYELIAAEDGQEDLKADSQKEIDRLAERVGQALGQLRQLKLD